MNDKTEDFVSVIPYVQEIQLSKNIRFLIIGSDGLWFHLKLFIYTIIRDVVSYKQAAIFAFFFRKNGKTLQETAEMLVDYAYDRGSNDNITAIIIEFSFT